MRRFFFKPEENNDSLITMEREESHHVATVLRLQTGEDIEMLDGTGNVYLGRIESIGRQVTVRLLSKVSAKRSEHPSLWLYQGDLKGKKMDLVVQKCTELGVNRLIPFISSRSQGRSTSERQERKHKRWQKLVQSACKQSGRPRLMTLEQEKSFVDSLNPVSLSPAAMKILFWEEEHHTRLADLDWQCPASEICLMLGPEGGFAESEVAAARLHGWQVVTLGDRVLRSETAAISAVSIVQHLLGAM